jgi:hypothetical protein
MVFFAGPKKNEEENFDAQVLSLNTSTTMILLRVALTFVLSERFTAQQISTRMSATTMISTN